MYIFVCVVYVCMCTHTHTHTYIFFFPNMNLTGLVFKSRTRGVGVLVNGDRILGFPLGIYPVCIACVCVWGGSVLLFCQSTREESIPYVSRSSSNAK